tara:strand:+ start:5933 stop:6931 length:999 start_codon:yes stop_codon:yes gene_type:complete
MAEEKEVLSQEAIPDGVIAEEPVVADVSADPNSVPQELDPFSELFEQDKMDWAFVDEPAPTGGVEVNETVAAESAPAEGTSSEQDVDKGNPDSFQYWQSQYDKSQSELNQTRQELEGMQQLAPIARYIQNNPNVLRTVEDHLSGGGTVPEAQSGQESQSLQRPERPAKPANYDPVDAYSDPESNSYQYRESVEDYRDGMIDFYEAQNDVMQQRMQNQAAQQQNQQYVENVKSQLVNTFDYAPDDAEDFIERYSDPTSVTLDNLVTLDKIKSAPPEEVLKNQRKAEKMRRQKEKAKMPEPVAVQPAESAQEPDVEDKLMDAMVTDYERQNPWT